MIMCFMVGKACLSFVSFLYFFIRRTNEFFAFFPFSCVRFVCYSMEYGISKCPQYWMRARDYNIYRERASRMGMGKKRNEEKLELSTNHLRIIERRKIFIFFSSLSCHSSFILFPFFRVICLCYSYWLTLDWNHVLLSLSFQLEIISTNTWTSERKKRRVSSVFFFVWLSTRSSDSYVVSVFGFRIDIDVSGPSAMLLKVNILRKNETGPKKLCW